MIEFELKRNGQSGRQAHFSLLLLRAEYHSEFLNIGVGVKQLLLFADTLVQVEEFFGRFAWYRFFRRRTGHGELVEHRHVTTGCSREEVSEFVE